ncbi:hypothetical protein O9G_005722 [Rozella allomycis CSF55]|uniref:Uncharacterized protein n=1 Tax=Rozella allomycis (strain CSF55) TaxID=988480 RepID=A0A075AU35_ROZAC|nr:hypothetical protein O9G_005722 [Rozella allomycis CSF55]|eukprot:EPZ32042.1 hypothetical protein O9G_005722 [Rozella allomycis CSF55]
MLEEYEKLASSLTALIVLATEADAKRDKREFHISFEACKRFSSITTPSLSNSQDGIDRCHGHVPFQGLLTNVGFSCFYEALLSTQ